MQKVPEHMENSKSPMTLPNIQALRFSALSAKKQNYLVDSLQSVAREVLPIPSGMAVDLHSSSTLMRATWTGFSSTL